MPSSKLLDQVRTTARLRHLSLKTEKVYVQHIKAFILFYGKRHPRDMVEGHVRDYLSHLAPFVPTETMVSVMGRRMQNRKR